MPSVSRAPSSPASLPAQTAATRRKPNRHAAGNRVAGDGADRRSEDLAYASISRALLAGKLRPGTPLRERYLADVFGVTRGAIRKVLLRLGHEGKVDLVHNRGASVPQPSQDDMTQVYGARRAVEAGLVALLAERISADQLARLRAHLREERRAERQHRRDQSVILSGAFHVELVNAVGNPELASIVERLVSRTRMYVALFEPAHESGCAVDEHEAIVAALAARDPSRAVAAMSAHLNNVEARVRERVERPEASDLGQILRSHL